ncbi:hypothetical protein NMY22_g4223 [Coprinellus aureogranulatus]|nr:hypothetical protein NMY22_g4223 [Coprinellus aureogranulatus]
MASAETAAIPAQQKSAKEIEDAKAMPPPPLPAKSVILEPELNALQDSLKNAVAQTGLVYKYYAKTFKSEVRHVQPPQSLTAALGRELEKYDQICDAMEVQILRAISTLQHDLAREEKRLEAEQAALKEKEREVESPEPMQEDEPSTQPITQPTTTNNSPTYIYPQA